MTRRSFAFVTFQVGRRCSGFDAAHSVSMSQPSLFPPEGELYPDFVRMPCRLLVPGILNDVPDAVPPFVVGWIIPEGSMYVELEDASWYESPVSVCWARALKPDRWDVIFSWDSTYCYSACSHETEEEARTCGTFLYEALYSFSLLDGEHRRVARELVASRMNLLNASKVAARIRELYEGR